MKKYEYIRVDATTSIKEASEKREQIRSTEDIINWHCANRDSEWELSTVAFDKNGHEILYFKKEAKW